MYRITPGLLHGDDIAQQLRRLIRLRSRCGLCGRRGLLCRSRFFRLHLRRRRRSVSGLCGRCGRRLRYRSSRRRNRLDRCRFSRDSGKLINFRRRLWRLRSRCRFRRGRRLFGLRLRCRCRFRCGRRRLGFRLRSRCRRGRGCRRGLCRLRLRCGRGGRGGGLCRLYLRCGRRRGRGCRRGLCRLRLRCGRRRGGLLCGLFLHITFKIVQQVVKVVLRKNTRRKDERNARHTYCCTNFFSSHLVCSLKRVLIIPYSYAIIKPHCNIFSVLSAKSVMVTSQPFAPFAIFFTLYFRFASSNSLPVVTVIFLPPPRLH